MRKSTIDYIDTVTLFMERAIAGEPMIFFDLETTGLKRSFNRILSCSAVKYRYNAGKFEEIGKLDFFMNPGFHIPAEASEVNGITDEMVKDAPDEDDGFEEDLIGSLKIEKINLNGTVKEGSTNEILRDYIGHIEETAKYDGNVGLAAHNRGNKYSYFARINELEPGDEIVYTTKYGERKYIVDTKKEILETDWSNLEGTSDNRLTLITCIKNKVNQRLCVQAVQENI